jgi:hypothetical protein
LADRERVGVSVEWALERGRGPWCGGAGVVGRTQRRSVTRWSGRCAMAQREVTPCQCGLRGPKTGGDRLAVWVCALYERQLHWWGRAFRARWLDWFVYCVADGPGDQPAQAGEARAGRAASLRCAGRPCAARGAGRGVRRGVPGVGCGVEYLAPTLAWSTWHLPWLLPWQAEKFDRPGPPRCAWGVDGLGLVALPCHALLSAPRLRCPRGCSRQAPVRRAGARPVVSAIAAHNTPRAPRW